MPDDVQQTPFVETLPEEFRAEPSLKDIKDLPGLVKSFVHAQRMIGSGDRVTIPSAEAKPEEMDAFWNRLGRPEKPEGYQFNAVKEEAMYKPSDDDRAWFSKTAHALGLSAKQASALFDAYVEKNDGVMVLSNQEAEKSLAAAEVALRKDWGAFYSDRLAVAKQAITKVAGPEFADFLNDTGLGNHPALAKAFYKIASLLGEDRLPGEGLNFTKGRTPEEAQRQIEANRKDPAFLKRWLSRDREAVEEMDKLFIAAYPS